MFKKIFLFICIACVAFTAQAQISFRLSVAEKAISLQDELFVTYTLSGTSHDVGMPMLNFEDWTVLSGPNTSSTQTWINGNKSATVAYSFVLAPKRTGKLIVPAAEIAIDGKVYKSNYTTVTVSESSAKGNPAQPQQQPAQRGSSIFDIFEDFFKDPSQPSSPSIRPGQTPQEFMKEHNFVKVTPSKSIAYLGEPILVTYDFYSGIRLAAINVTKQPSFNGAGVVEMTEEKEPFKTVHNGKEYVVYRIRQVQLVPLKTGTITLDAAEVTTDIMVNDNYGLSATKQTAIIKNVPVNITIQPLPPAKPKGFNGNIGQFTITANVERATLPAGENNYLTVQITGQGNIEGIKLPDIKFPDNIQPFTPTDSQSVNKQIFPMEGSKIFKIPIIGRAAGTAVIPAIGFSFFDNEDNSYKTINTVPITVNFTAPLQKGTYERPLNADTSNNKYVWLLGMIALAAIAVFVLFGRNKNTQNAPPSTKENIKPLNPNNYKTVAQQHTVLPEMKDTDLAKEIAVLEQEIQETGFYSKAKKILVASLQQRLRSNSPTEYSLMEELKAAPVNPVLKNDYENLLQKINKGLYLPIVNMEERKQVLAALRYLVQKS